MMMIQKQSFLRISVLLALMAAVVVLVGAGGLLVANMAGASAPNAPLAAPAAAPLPTATCTLVGSARTCDLWAREGTLTMVDGVTVPIWGFSDTAGGAAQLPGPPIIVNEGELVTVILHNDMLSETVSLSFLGQSLVPDMVGAAPGITTSYTFTASGPGTFYYEAGLTANGGRQVAMGMVGGLIVRPDPTLIPPVGMTGLAFSDPSTGFNQEALLVLNEIDPDFNADPLNFDLVQFKPQYWLINGKSYSQTDKIVVNAGDMVLLRYINAGLQEHTLGILGLHQSIIAIDGYQLPYSYDQVVRSMGSGETSGALVSVPATAFLNQHIPIYNTGQQQLHNDGQGPYGGIMTFIEVGSSPVINLPPGGPLATNLQAAPNPATPGMPISLTADLDTSSRSGLDVVEWEYFINGLGADGTGVTATVASPTPTTSVMTIIPTSTLSTITPGDVTLYVHGKDANGDWGPVSSVLFDLLTTGPSITSLDLYDNPSNGSKVVGIQATADETVVGNVNVVAAEYFIDTPGLDGSGTALNLNQQAPIVSVTGDIPTSTLQGLTEGVHTFYIHGQDALGNWGGYTTMDLVIDLTGPAATGVRLDPSPNNGTLSVHSSSVGVWLEVNVVDTTNIVDVEAFIDYTNVISDPNGSGFPLIASDALYDSPQESAYFVIPLNTIRRLSEGPHSIDFHGLDSAGNWGPLGSMTLVVDVTGPSITNVAASPNPVTGGTGPMVTLTATATDAAANLTNAEWFDGADPGVSRGVAMAASDGAFDSMTEAITATIDTSTWTTGAHVVSIRAKDIAGNWGDVMTTTLTIQSGAPRGVMDANFESAQFAGWDTAVGQLNITGAAASAGSLGLEAITDGGAPAFLARRLASNFYTDYTVSFDFSPHTAVTDGTAQEIFTALDQSGQAIFGIRFEQGQQGPELSAWTRRDDGVVVKSAPVQINGSIQNIKLDWASGSSTDLVFKINDTVVAAIHDLQTSSHRLSEVRLGPSDGVLDTASGAYYFDSFELLPKQTLLFLPLVVNGN